MPYVESQDGTVFNTDYPSYHPDCKVLTKAEGKRKVREQSLNHLRDMLKPKDTVFTILRHVSSSGMSRRIGLYVIKDNRPVNISLDVATVLDSRTGKDGGVVIGGCGMDMGFNLVYNLGRVLWPEGTPEPHGTRNGEPDSSGGYALKHEWM